MKYDNLSTEEQKNAELFRGFLEIAYSVSIHKAQGLEYDSVKVIISGNNAERITHGIFYTAITRAKKNLKIYCSSETLKAVISRIYAEEQNRKSLGLIKDKPSQQ